MKSNSIAMGSHEKPRPSNGRGSQESPRTDGSGITYSHLVFFPGGAQA